MRAWLAEFSSCRACQAIFWFVFCKTRLTIGADSMWSTVAAGLAAGCAQTPARG